MEATDFLHDYCIWACSPESSATVYLLLSMLSTPKYLATLLPLGISCTTRQPQKSPGSVSLVPKSPFSPSTTLTESRPATPPLPPHPVLPSPLSGSFKPRRQGASCPQCHIADSKSGADCLLGTVFLSAPSSLQNPKAPDEASPHPSPRKGLR